MSTNTNALASSSRIHDSSKKSKKNKFSSAPTTDGAVMKKSKETSKRHGDKEGKHKDKGGGKEKERKGPFELHQSRMRLSVPSKFGADYMAGVRELLDGMVMRYVPQLSGVLLAHWEHEFIDDTVKIINECPYGVCEVEFRSIVWAPKIGQKLYGVHSLSSPSHLSLLFSRTFNISIPLQHIPLDEYVFEHTSSADQNGAESDDESDVSDSEDEGEFGLHLGAGAGNVHEVGRWKGRKDGKLLGEGGRGVKFTVIGMQVTNQVLSLTGSLLSDPFNPPPPPSPARIALPPSPSPTPEPVDLDTPPASRKLKVKAKHTAKAQGNQNGAANGSNAPTAPVIHTETEPEIDESLLSARELKKKRKEEEKRKRDERKARKERELEEVAPVGGGNPVDNKEDKKAGFGNGEGEGRKRKAEDGGEGKKKKRQCLVGLDL